MSSSKVRNQQKVWKYCIQNDYTEENINGEKWRIPRLIAFITREIEKQVVMKATDVYITPSSEAKKLNGLLEDINSNKEIKAADLEKYDAIFLADLLMKIITKNKEPLIPKAHLDALLHICIYESDKNVQLRRAKTYLSDNLETINHSLLYLICTHLEIVCDKVKKREFILDAFSKTMVRNGDMQDRALNISVFFEFFIKHFNELFKVPLKY